MFVNGINVLLCVLVNGHIEALCVFVNGHNFFLHECCRMDIRSYWDCY